MVYISNSDLMLIIEGILMQLVFKHKIQRLDFCGGNTQRKDGSTTVSSRLGVP